MMEVMNERDARYRIRAKDALIEIAHSTHERAKDRIAAASAILMAPEYGVHSGAVEEETA